ncbi:MAG: hypothetical protein WBA13_02905 [Microcoleaceae cyanobacterium]
MNASEQAKSIEFLSKIATVMNLFTSEFPDTSVDLSPWLKNTETAKFDDPDSIDLAFHFQQRSFACQSQCILMQIRLPPASKANSYRKMSIELSGHDYTGQQWRFDTTRQHVFWGRVLPLPEAEEKLRPLCITILQLFEPAKKSSTSGQ